MRKTFLKWLFFFIVAAFIVTLGISFYIQTRHAHQNAERIILLKIEDASHLLRISSENVKEIEETTKNNALIKARIFARLIQLDQTALKNTKKFDAIRKLLDVDELHVSNEKGILTNCIPKRYEGYDMHWAEQSSAFLPALTDSSFELAQNIRGKGINSFEKFQYVGVARRDKTGLVQIGYKPDRLINAMKWIDLRELADSFRIGKTGFLLVYHDKTLINGQARSKLGIKADSLRIGELFCITINNTKYLGYARRINEFLYAGFIPQNEIFMSRTNLMIFFIITNFFLFTLVFILVSFLLQKVVISGILKINHSLDLITQGNLNERIQVDNTEEFTALSKGINATVTALKAANQEMAAKIDSELRLAKMIQTASLPNETTPFPLRHEFGIYGITEPAETIGGDFYDYLLTDEDHLTFLVADVSNKGIPAALLMMKSKTLFENLTVSNLKVNEILSQANDLFCHQNSETAMFVSLLICQLEISTGKLMCANAGHCPPIFKKENKPFEFWHIPSGLALGILPDQKYVATTFHLKPEDQIVLYSDGVVNAINGNEEPFGEDRLLNALNNPLMQDLDVSQFPGVFNNILSRYTAGLEQADDITILNFVYHGPNEENNSETDLQLT